jgi:sulfatase modifying factor 1
MYLLYSKMRPLFPLLICSTLLWGCDTQRDSSELPSRGNSKQMKPDPQEPGKPLNERVDGDVRKPAEVPSNTNITPVAKISEPDNAPITPDTEKQATTEPVTPGPSPLFPEAVIVGDTGNAADVTGFGAVAYVYRIGKFEVTNAEYCEFLNATAKKDPYQLYDHRMAESHGGINRSGEFGNYSYKTKDAGGRKPVGYVTWESCSRYANWLSNGGGNTDTEKGCYLLKGGSQPIVTLPDHAALAAGKTTKWVIASENEWYKAAYYDPDKPGGAGYWNFAMSGGSAPSCNINSNEISEAGAFKVASPYGTYDQNGNLWEYNETRNDNKVGLRGGSFFIDDHEAYLLSQTRYEVLSAKWPNYGFRVVALGGNTNTGPVSTQEK